MRRGVVAVALTVGAVAIVATTPTSAQTPPLPESAVQATSAPPLVPPSAPAPNTTPSAAPPASEARPPLAGAPSAAAPVPTGAGVGNTAQPPLVETTARRWYGWQTLMLDALWMVGIPASLKDQNGTGLFLVSGVDYLLGAPIVHWAHGHGVKGAGSLFMRITPLVAGIAIAAGGSGNGDEGLSNFFTGLAVLYVGGVVAAAIDAAVLAHEDVPQAPPPPLTVAPRLSLTKGGATLGVAGAF